jgi:hypothetical protein
MYISVGKWNLFVMAAITSFGVLFPAAFGVFI